MTNLYIRGLNTGNVSIEGDAESPSVKLSINETRSVPTINVVGNALFCDTCSKFITNGKISIRLNDQFTGRLLTSIEMESLKNGTIFDLNDDSVVDEASTVAGGLLSDGVTITGTGLPGDPFIAIGGGSPITLQSAYEGGMLS